MTNNENNEAHQAEEVLNLILDERAAEVRALRADTDRRKRQLDAARRVIGTKSFK